VIAVSRAQSEHVESTGRIIGRVTVIIFLSSIFVTSLLGFLLIRHTNESLMRLREGTVRIGGGDLDYRITVPSHDEFGQLAAAFNDMSEKLRVRCWRCRRPRSRPIAPTPPRAASWPT
jgi:methyl-accepting chemotaxis protein